MRYVSFSEVNTFELIGKNLFFLKKSVSSGMLWDLFIFEDWENKKIKDSNTLPVLRSTTKNIIFKSQEGNHVLSLQGEQQMILQDSAFIEWCGEDSYIRRSYINSEHDLELYNYKQDQVCWQLGYSALNLIVFQNFLFTLPYTESVKGSIRISVRCHDIHSGALNWEYVLRPEFERDEDDQYRPVGFFGFLGVFDEVLYCRDYSGAVLGLSVKSGLEVYSLFNNRHPDILGGKLRDETIRNLRALSGFSQIDYEKELIFGLASNVYVEISLRDPMNEVFIFDPREMFDSAQRIWGIESSYTQQAWYGDHILFYSSPSPKTFGLFSRSERKIIWTSDILGDDGLITGISKAVMTVDKIYILSSDRTLHIFERGGLIP